MSLSILSLSLPSCERKEAAAPAREPRPALPRSSAPAAASPTDLAADALTTAIGPDATFKAAAELAKTGTAHAVQLLIAEATSRQDEAEAAAVLDSFALLTTPESLATLTELSVRGKSPAVFKAATATLADRANGETVDLLVSLLYDRPAPADRTHKVRIVLQSIRNPAADRALGKLLLSAPEPGVIESAATALGTLATPGARASLQQALDDRPDLPPILRTSIQRSLEKAQSEK